VLSGVVGGVAGGVVGGCLLFPLGTRFSWYDDNIAAAPADPNRPEEEREFRSLQYSLCQHGMTLVRESES